jgi:hypothetical protein
MTIPYWIKIWQDVRRHISQAAFRMFFLDHGRLSVSVCRVKISVVSYRKYSTVLLELARNFMERAKNFKMDIQQYANQTF